MGMSVGGKGAMQAPREWREWAISISDTHMAIGTFLVCLFLVHTAQLRAASGEAI